MKNKITITVQVNYLEHQSNAANNQYTYTYTINIKNDGEVGATLLTRHWYIKDETGNIEEVVGEGVIGKQPYIEPGKAFKYSSGAIIKTLTGSMYGSYSMVNSAGEYFEAQIPEFILSEPYTLH
jgi:ApaG protein